MPPERKALAAGLQRRVRPRREDKWEPEPESPPPASSSAASDTDDSSSSSSSDNQDDSREQDGSSSEGRGPEIDPSSSSISFGALARAQGSLLLPGAASRAGTTRTAARGHTAEPSARRETTTSSPAATRRDPPPRRSSKHAPRVQTSKRPVPRLREILPDPRRGKPRDPRFDPLLGRLDERRTRKAYGFLDDYRRSEMGDLRARIAEAKDPLDRDALRRELMAMESREKAAAGKAEEEALLVEHRAREKELVAQGKTPFYLKRGERKRRLLVGRYEKMSGGQVERAIERRRKKLAGREKKELARLVRRR